ncbi:protein containing DUF99, partial [mine drainage metagenome]
MRRALGKPHFHVIGIDDGAFRRGDRWAPVAAVLLAVPARVEAVRVGRVPIDGTGAARRLGDLIRELPGHESARAVLLDGAVVGGFNVVDLDALRHDTGLPVVAVTARRPDFAAIRHALRTWFPRDATRRFRALSAHRLYALPGPSGAVFVAAVGCTRFDAAALVRRATVEGHVPEPIRLAHLVASAVGSERLAKRTVKV